MLKQQWLGLQVASICLWLEIIHFWVFHQYLFITILFGFHLRICFNRRSETPHWTLNDNELWGVFCSPVCGTCSMSSTCPLWKTPSRTCVSALPPSSWWPSYCWASTSSQPSWWSSRSAWYWWTSWVSCTSGTSPSMLCPSSTWSW